MRSAHQGVPVASLPEFAQRRRRFCSRICSSPLRRLSAAPPAVAPPSAQALFRSQPIPSRWRRIARRRLRISAPDRIDARPEADAGLDGWLMDRLFGGRR